MHIFDPDYLDHNKENLYLSIATEEGDITSAYMLFLERTILFDLYFPPFDCESFLLQVMKLQDFNEMDDYYKLGYKKYLLGEFDQALMIFSFCAMLGRTICVKAAAYIWENNLTKNISCNLGQHML